MHKFLSPLALLAWSVATPTAAYEKHELRNTAGEVIFEARFYEPSDGVWGKEGETSLWPWQPHIKKHVLKGISYWAEMLQPQGDQGPAILNIATDDTEENAFGGSEQGDGGADHRNLLQRHFQGLPVAPQDTFQGAHGVYGLGPSNFSPHDYWFTQLPLTGYDDLVSTTIHEVAHALGIDSLADQDDDNEYMPRFGDVPGGWSAIMFDDHGRPARPGQAILCDYCEHPYDPDAFDARADRAVIAGPNIAEVLEGALPGVPVSMYAWFGDERVFDNNNMSHSELKNSMMSHQNYRNYTGFMEAELATLQDLGYTLDRRNYFGRSIYGSGLDIVNNRGFFARNAQGTDYLPGQYNTALLGLGLHVYGSQNRVRQTADLLAAGEGGAGIRVDGEGNTLVIDPGVRVHANGMGGQGVMFAYGRHHTLVHQGEIEALGPNGVGLRFDFGNNALQNKSEYRGSYIHTIEEEPVVPAAELQGPLVTRADITGRVAGSEAAIYMGATGYVGSLNLMQGAAIQGDIVSFYDQRDEAGVQRLTKVSFGQQADADGRATGRADTNFFMAYGGNIRGQQNLSLSFDGGATVLSGHHAVHDVAVRPEAILAGTPVFALANGAEFLNEGRLMPGTSIGTLSVEGDFRQTASGRLQVEFTPDGEHDVLAVSGSVDLAGTLELAPTEGWYDNAWTLQAEPVLAAGARAGDFETLAVASVSPTLAFDAAMVAEQGVTITVARAGDAYSRYANNPNARAAGRALERSLTESAASPMRPFLQAMDFSAADGTEVSRVLNLVSPQGYSAGLAASLLRERDVMENALRGFGEGLRNAEGSDWQGFAVLFGSDGRQNNRGSMLGYDATTYGLVIGGGRKLAANPDFAVGVHLDIADQRLTLASPQWGKGESTAVGVGAQLQYQPDAMAGAYAHAGLRIGIERGSMDRHVAVHNYYAAHSADWTGHSASAQAGAGYLFPLSPAVSAGPIASLNYSRVSRPAVDESGPMATRLELASRHVDALRSSLGLGAVMRHALDDGSVLSGRVEATWDHEWLDRDVLQDARFAGAASASAASFNSKNAVLPRNSLGLRTSLQWQHSQRFSIGAGLGGRLGDGFKSIEGQLSVRWLF